MLLIVPYGIETCLRLRRGQGRELLIVPYGIETNHEAGSCSAHRPFNRTLWN